MIEEVRARLEQYNGVRFTETRDSIEVHPVDETGFKVTLQLEGSSATVHFEGWHEHFSSPEAALDCFAFGLSEECRLKVVYRGSTPTRSVVESNSQGVWVADSEVGVLMSPFWLPKRVVYRQNRLMSSDRGGDSSSGAAAL